MFGNGACRLPIIKSMCGEHKTIS